MKTAPGQPRLDSRSKTVAAHEEVARYAARTSPYSGDLQGLVQEDNPLERVRRVRAGVKLRDAMQVQQRLDMPKSRFYSILGLPEATMKRKEKGDARLSPEQTERVLGVARLIGEVERMVAESGKPEGFDAGAWVADWLEQPVPALGGQKPAELMDTLSGQALVLDVVARMQSGAYA